MFKKIFGKPVGPETNLGLSRPSVEEPDPNEKEPTFQLNWWVTNNLVEVSGTPTANESGDLEEVVLKPALQKLSGRYTILGIAPIVKDSLDARATSHLVTVIPKSES